MKEITHIFYRKKEIFFFDLFILLFFQGMPNSSTLGKTMIRIDGLIFYKILKYGMHA